MKDTIKRQTMIIISIIGIIVVSLMMGLTYAYQSVVVTYSEGSDDDLSIKAGVLDVDFKATRRINETNLELMTDYTNAKYSQFTVTNNSSFLVSYYIGLTDLTCSPELASADFKYTLAKYNGNNIEFIYTGDFSGLDCSSGKYEFMLDGSKYRTLSIGESETLRLYLWLEETDENQNSLENTNFKGKLEITSVFEKDLIETVENPYAEGSLAYSIINNANNVTYGTKIRNKSITLSGANTKDQNAPYVLVQTEEENSHYIHGSYDSWNLVTADDYTFDSKNGINLNSSNTINISSFAGINNELNGKYINIYDYRNLFDNFNSSTNLKGIIKYNEDGSKIKRILAVSEGKGIESSLVKSNDDDNVAYYFRGEVEDNYLNFNGMCFRIVSILDDGSVKVVLADKNNECNNAGYSKYNATSSFVSYTYFASLNYERDYNNYLYTFEAPNLNYFNNLKEWLTNNFDNTLQKKLVDYDVNFGKIIESFDYDTFATEFSEEDFIISENINLLTTKEVQKAGSYLEYNAYSNWWRADIKVETGGCYNSLYAYCSTTTDPYYYAYVGIGCADSAYDRSDNKAYLRPAIVLKSNLTVTGNGTQSDPYVVI